MVKKIILLWQSYLLTTYQANFCGQHKSQITCLETEVERTPKDGNWKNRETEVDISFERDLAKFGDGNTKGLVEINCFILIVKF